MSDEIPNVIKLKPSEDQVGGTHYKDFVIQPAEFIHKNDIGFLEGNVIKYVCRHNKKNGKNPALQDKDILYFPKRSHGNTYGSVQGVIGSIFSFNALSTLLR